MGQHLTSCLAIVRFVGLHTMLLSNGLSMTAAAFSRRLTSSGILVFELFLTAFLFAVMFDALRVQSYDEHKNGTEKRNLSQ